MTKKTTPAARPASHRILVVENQHELGKLLHTGLEKLSFPVQLLAVPSGEEAVLDASRQHIDLLVADYLLPGMTGIELMHKIRQRQPGIKVILVCGQSDSKICEQVLAAGADGCFLKPIPVADFFTAVNRLLGPQEPPPLPDELIPRWEEAAPPVTTLSEILAKRRHDLDARAVLLIDGSGQVVARAGELPDKDTELALLSYILTIYSAGQKISHLLKEQGLSNWSVFDGGRYDLIFVPLDREYALLSIGENLARQKDILRKVTALRRSRGPILTAISQDAIPFQLEAPPSSGIARQETGEVVNGELEPLLKEWENKPPAEDADDFWEQAAREQEAPLKADTLSYDQARQLGLTPEEDS